MKAELLHPKLAIAEILKQVPLVTTEQVSLEDAFGAVLATDIVSMINLPSFNNSSMDGYAYNIADANNELKLVGTSFAGHPYYGDCAPNTCIRIMTGALVPSGYDSVQMQEKVTITERGVKILDPKLGSHIRFEGEEVKAQTKVLSKGTLIQAAQLGVLATVGVSKLLVYKKLRVAFFSTGDELVAVGNKLNPGQIYDSNRYTLRGLLTQAGVDWIDMGVIQDNYQDVKDAFLKASICSDLIITSGGVSVGDADFIKQVLEEIGTLSLWRLALKPGKPFAFGKISNALFCGLPGNPVSAMVTFQKLVRPIILKASGQNEITTFLHRAKLTHNLEKKDQRVEYIRGIVTTNINGELEVTTTGSQSSGMLTSMTLANCYIVLESAVSLLTGAIVNIEFFE